MKSIKVKVENRSEFCLVKLFVLHNGCHIVHQGTGPQSAFNLKIYGEVKNLNNFIDQYNNSQLAF
jgi:hypothetical protein